MYRFINDTNCKCLTHKCLKRYFIFNMPTETIKFGVCSDYIRLLLMDNVKDYERLYNSIMIKYDAADIVTNLLSKYVEIYDKVYYGYGRKQPAKNDFTKLKVEFSISDKIYSYRSMSIINALEIIMNRENNINSDFIYRVIHTIKKWIDNLKSKVSIAKYNELIKLNKNMWQMNYDENLQREYLLKIYQAQIKINK